MLMAFSMNVVHRSIVVLALSKCKINKVVYFTFFMTVIKFFISVGFQKKSTTGI